MNTRGFSLVREERLSEVSGTVKLWRHDATGAELLSIVNNDENKCLGATFRTPPKDSTGVAHILEHSVLCLWGKRAGGFWRSMPLLCSPYVVCP